MIEKYIDILKKNEKLEFELCFEMAQTCLSILDADNKKEAYDLIIYVLEYWDKITPTCQELWADIVEKVGFYPYLSKYKEKIPLQSTAALLRKEFFNSRNIENIYFHEQQNDLLEEFNTGKNLIVSAPTSFGKSLLIEEIIASKQFKNIVIIQPTLALLDETRRKMFKYSDSYKLIIRTSQDYTTERGNIFLFTAERVLEYKNLPQIDFIVIDEFYKLSTKRDDERSDILNNALYLLLTKYNPRFMLLGPNIQNVSDGFSEKYNAIFYKTNYSLVANEAIDIYKEHEGKFGSRGSKKLYKENVLFELLYSLQNEKTLVFCSSPSRVRELSGKYTQFLKSKGQDESFDCPLIEWIKDNVSEKWSLIDSLNYGIGIHDGALPRHLTSSIINYFNTSTMMNCIFCTTTIIEGVNTSTKNIVYFDSKKGLNIDIDYFDYSNIKGRAGRMMEHFVGKIYNFNPIPPQEQIIVDIPFHEQNPVSDEVLININKNDIINNSSEQAKKIEEIPEQLKKIIRRNGVSVQGQLNIVETLMNDFKYDLIYWDNYPTYRQLEYLLYLCWDNLLKPTETTRPMTKRSLVYQTFNYAMDKNLASIVDDKFRYYRMREGQKDELELYNDAIRDAFQILRHWFQYKVPKWINVMNSLQEYVCMQKGCKPGNYSFYSSSIENDFLRENLVLLSEYNIPSSALRKLEKFIPAQLNEDDVCKYIKSNFDKITFELITYEKEKIQENL